MKLKKVKAYEIRGQAQCYSFNSDCHFRRQAVCFSKIDKRTRKSAQEICREEKVIFVRERKCAICGNCIDLLEGA
jgi:hypothetical protein